jgi:hypothetical protein
VGFGGKKGGEKCHKMADLWQKSVEFFRKSGENLWKSGGFFMG